jgi:hypothetical protein
MASLGRELRLIKGALEQLCGHFELLLAEIDAMQATDEAKSGDARFRDRHLSPLPDREIVRESVEEDGLDACALPRTEDAAAAPAVDEEFWAALRAAVAEAPPREELCELPAGTACDRIVEAIGRPTIDPAGVRDAASRADLPVAVGSAVDRAANAADDGVVAAGATPASIYVIAYRQRRRQPQRRLSRPTALAALIATILVMALVGFGVTRGFADLPPRIDAEARPS